ncbi:MAG: hypothetical protein UH625_01720 [Muribaculaceae bacterium]|nr:hypothetical protein [Muribaculaceae bacterium]
MKTFLKSIICGACLFSAIQSQAECSVNLAVISAPQDENVPEATINFLNNRLAQIITQDGITADPSMEQFFIAGKFSHIREDVVPGPPAQTALHTTLTLYIGDVNSQTVYASTSIDLRGVGTSDQRAYINALRALNSKNNRIASFINSGKAKVISYYDSNYPSIIAKADRFAASHNYEAALWQLSFIPECCKGYNTAMASTVKYFQAYIDQQGEALLNKAYAAWSTSPDADGAAEAFEYLTLIDPQSAVYPRAIKLAAEIKASIKSDRDFELREKYHDSVDLKKAMINGAREVGVAYGRGQQPTTTNLMWLK